MRSRRNGTRCIQISHPSRRLSSSRVVQTASLGPHCEVAADRQHNEIRIESYRIGCSNVQSEEASDYDYDDYDADDVENVHCVLRLSHA